MAEQVILDPAELATGRTSLDLTPWLSQDGIDWGDSDIAAAVSSAQRGAIPVDYSVPNRVISGGLAFTKTTNGTTTTQARAAIQAKLSRMQQEGGWIKRTTNAGSVVYADVVNASFRATSVAGWESRSDVDTSASFSLETLPDFYGDEVTLTDHTETTATEIVFTEASVRGDYPGRVRVVVDNDGTADWLGLLWSFRSRHYSSAATAKTFYEAEELQALDTATKVALSGASGGTVVTHGTVSTNWTPVVGTNIGGTSFLTNTGTNRLRARVYSTSGTLVQTRAVSDVGDLVNPEENSATRLSGASNFYIVDYGEVRLDQTPVGTHRWQGQIQAKGDVGTENFSVDKIWITNQDEGGGVLSAPLDGGRSSMTAYSARSEFNTESGAITGDTAAVGGVWAGAGDADDFSVSSATAQRTAVSDADVNTGRYLISGVAAFAAQTVQIDFKTDVPATSPGSAQLLGILARYADTSNWLRATYQPRYSAGVSKIVVEKRVAGSVTELASVYAVLNENRYYTFRLLVDASGRWMLWYAAQSGALSGVPLLSGQDSTLATGGALASGKPGIYDAYVGASASTRTYDNFAAWAPASDAVVFAGRSAQLTTQGHFRQDSAGSVYGPVSISTGDLPRIPVTTDGRTTEVFLKPSRGDFDQQPDSAIGDDISARVFYRPSWLFIDA